MRLSDDPEIVNHLYRSGFHSAAAIANRPLHGVRAQLARGSDGSGTVSDAALARVHAAAVDLHSRAVHLAAQMRAVLSPHGRVASSNNAIAALATEFSHLPSFSDLFGSQDFIPSPHCQSVVGPAAYFVDLMRVVDEQITSNPKNTIPDWARLATRRKGLFTQPLTCAETTTPVPKLQIVNQVIHDFLVHGKTPSHFRGGAVLCTSRVMSPPRASHCSPWQVSRVRQFDLGSLRRSGSNERAWHCVQAPHPNLADSGTSLF
jgi:hypothetical protein